MAASQPIVMPKLGLTMTEGMLAEWKVAPGDTVKAGQIMFVVETDKISNDVEATADAVVEALHVAVGDVVPVGELVATVRSEQAVQDPVQIPAESTPVANPAAQPPRIIATPLARRLASGAGLDLASLKGSGPRGRIMADDVSAALEAGGPAAVPEAAVAPAAVPAPTPAEARGTVRPFSQYQKVAARRLTEAKRDIPHFYVMAEADVSELIDLRGRLNDVPGHSKLTVNHFIIAAVARALVAMPEVNVVWAEDGVMELARVDVGMAVEGPKGLVAPVLRDLGAAGVDQVAIAATALVERARSGSLSSSDLQGGAISISNVGMFGATGLIPIVNPGQSAILGVGRNIAQFRPDRTGQPVLRQILNLALSCDHRVIDGALAARFLQQVQRGLEAPLSLLRSHPQGTAS